MRLLLLSILSISLSMNSSAQDYEGSEIGIDATFFASGGAVRSGTFGVGAKYGFKFGENIILGPSLRYHRFWSNNTITGTEGGYNIFGGGAFVHARFNNVIFIGLEAELLRSPFTNNGLLTSTNKWVGTCLVGGGFSREFNESFRINAGIYYDVLDIPNPSNPDNPNPNSPLQPYLTKRADGTVIPIVYRIAFFFPL